MFNDYQPIKSIDSRDRVIIRINATVVYRSFVFHTICSVRDWSIGENKNSMFLFYYGWLILMRLLEFSRCISLLFRRIKCNSLITVGWLKAYMNRRIASFEYKSPVIYWLLINNTRILRLKMYCACNTEF